MIFHQTENCWRGSVLSAAIVWGLLLTAITEVLSLGRLLTFYWLIGIWLLIDFVLIFIYFRFFRKSNRLSNQRSDLKLSSFSSLLLCGVAFIVATVGLTALIASPNNWDSMSYRLARVVHWIQNHSVAYYPTSYLPQLYQKPWSEFTIMHFQILSGGDHFANLVQWFSMVGCIIGVSLIAKQIGADFRGQVLSAVICATIPMGILQGSSTQGDYVVSFWLVCFVYYVLLALPERKISANLLKLGASLGLAFFTKGTSYIYAFPFFVWFLVSGVKRFGWTLWKQFLWITLLVIVINIGHEIRNIDLFGRPLASGEEKYSNDVFTISVLLSNIIRNIGLHIYIPSQFVRNFIEGLIRLIHQFLGIGISDHRTTWPDTEFRLPSDLPSQLAEDSAPNTIHLLLIIGTISLFFKQKKENKLVIYLICLISGFSLFCFILRWQPWHSRLHLPIFVLFSAFVGVILSRLLYRKIANSVALILILSSFLWVFCNTNRPLVSPISKKILTPSSYENIFNTSRIDQYFRNRQELRKPYTGAVSFLNSQKCSKVGLSLGADDWEYPFWILLQKNHNDKIYQIDQVNVENISAKKSQVYPHNNFVPCAIISVKKEDIINSKANYVKEWSIDPVSVFIKR
ncbi:MAG: glycosyltransferase family 39 protein [Stigonema ocellatum SAG 48.90 = DSM 106950]|nr:glycosyltransferase family 39 protein [Stigonema ocellatum SAG 48.90 = DSM 106950]